MKYKVNNKVFGLVFGILLLIVTIIVYEHYKTFFSKNTSFVDDEIFLFIPTGSGELKLKKQISPYLSDTSSFFKAAEKKNYFNNIKAGKFRIQKDFSNNDIINSLRSQNIPVKITFNNVERLEDLASKISKVIEADSLSLMKSFFETDFLLNNQLTKESVFAIFLPNTYEFYWNTNSDQFRDRMLNQFNIFWNSKRLKKADLINMSPVEVSVLASIVQRETPKPDERPTISGVYMNRIKKRMKLQADPTVVYSIKQKKGFDIKIRRVLYRDLKINSPYNTYKYRGLPPGPIYMPDLNSIESVLNMEKHNYLFFVADVSRPGYHIFAENLYQHNRNKKQYTSWLKKNKIRR